MILDRKKRFNSPAEKSLITHFNSKSAISEAYRTLRTNMYFAGIERPFQSILVTSPFSNDGKSTITANLAVVLAQAGHNVIVIDCDLRKPTQHIIFSLPNNQGFTNCLMQNLDPEPIAHKGLEKHLSVLTSGPLPPNPAELLASDKNREFLNNLKPKYDYVLIDTPPVAVVTDAAVLANRVDGVILVIKSGVTRIDSAVDVKHQLDRAKARVIGVVLNEVKLASSEYYHYYK